MKRRKYKIPCKELWVIQKEITGNTDKILSMFELANIIACLKGWPEIVDMQPKYREFSKQYLVKYINERDNKLSASPEKATSYVYFIQQGNNGAIKIGVADNINSRLVSLQTGSPVKLNLLASIGCKGRLQAYSIENKLHKKFDAYRLEGEWFLRKLITRLHEIEEIIEWAGEDLSEKIFFNKIERNKKESLI